MMYARVSLTKLSVFDPIDREISFFVVSHPLWVRKGEGSPMSVDVSVVVPVFNSEKYLPQCINSLIRQSLKNVEFIFVDDGSSDHSAEIIEGFQRKDSRIQLIRQKNQYAGVARNNGMKVATGKYIIFLDSDDFFELNMLEEAFKCAEKNQAEITVFGFSYYDDKTGQIHEQPHACFPEKVFSIEDMGDNFFFLYVAAPWNKLYLRSFVAENLLMFQPIKKCNDTYFTHIAACLAKRIVSLKQRFVFYRTNNVESLQGDYNRNRDDFVDCELAIRSKLIEKGIYSGVCKSAYLAYAKAWLCAFGSVKNANICSLQKYYYRVKEALVPGLFDSIEDFSDNPLIVQFYDGTFESFLLYQASELSNENDRLVKEMVSKSSKDYLIGHSLLIVPRKIKQLLRVALRKKE